MTLNQSAADRLGDESSVDRELAYNDAFGSLGVSDPHLGLDRLAEAANGTRTGFRIYHVTTDTHVSTVFVRSDVPEHVRSNQIGLAKTAVINCLGLPIDTEMGHVHMETEEARAIHNRLK